MDLERSHGSWIVDRRDGSEYLDLPKFNWPRVENPELRFPVDPAELQRVAGAEAQAIGQIKQAIDQLGDRVAGLIVEPIQSKEFWKFSIRFILKGGQQ